MASQHKYKLGRVDPSISAILHKEFPGRIDPNSHITVNMMVHTTKEEADASVAAIQNSLLQSSEITINIIKSNNDLISYDQSFLKTHWNLTTEGTTLRTYTRLVNVRTIFIKTITSNFFEALDKVVNNDINRSKEAKEVLHNQIVKIQALFHSKHTIQLDDLMRAKDSKTEIHAKLSTLCTNALNAINALDLTYEQLF